MRGIHGDAAVARMDAAYRQIMPAFSHCACRRMHTVRSAEGDIAVAPGPVVHRLRRPAVRGGQQARQVDFQFVDGATGRLAARRDPAACGQPQDPPPWLAWRFALPTRRQAARDGPAGVSQDAPRVLCGAQQEAALQIAQLRPPATRPRFCQAGQRFGEPFGFGAIPDRVARAVLNLMRARVGASTGFSHCRSGHASGLCAPCDRPCQVQIRSRDSVIGDGFFHASDDPGLLRVANLIGLLLQLGDLCVDF